MKLYFGSVYTLPFCYNKKMKNILIVGATHGHEYLGVKIIYKLKKLNLENVFFEIGNPEAYQKNIQFIDSDLNRVFPGGKDGNYEERRAFELERKIKKMDLVIDIHTTNTIKKQEDEMLIVTNLNDEILKIIKIIKPANVLIMKYKSDEALISQTKNGIAFEYGSNEDKAAFNKIYNQILLILNEYGILKDFNIKKNRSVQKTRFFEVYDIFKKNKNKKYALLKNIKNFSLIRKGQEIAKAEEDVIYSDEYFIPILFGENRYSGYFGFKSREVFISDVERV